MHTTQTEIEKIETAKSELSQLQPFEIEIAEMVKNYSNLVVTEQTLPEVRLAHETVSKKRIEVGRIRTDGTSKFEMLKKQFQTNADRLINLLLPIENKLKSDINTFDDDDIWAKAIKENTSKSYTTYINKFDNPKFEYKGKNVLQARAKLEAFENAAKAQIQNFQKFVDAGFRINATTYPTKEKAIEAKDKLTTLAITPEIYGEKVAEIIGRRSQFLELFTNLISELDIKEKQAAETARVERIKAAIDEMRKYQTRIINEKNISELNAIMQIFEGTKIHQSFYEEFYQQATSEFEAIKVLVINQIAKVADEARIAEIAAENERKTKELEERQKEMERKEAELIEAEKLRIDQIAAKEKELADLKEIQQKQEVEKMRIEDLKLQGLVEINGKTFPIDLIEEINTYFDNAFIPDYTLAISDMEKGKAEGRKTWSDLSDLQRANLVLRNEMNTSITFFIEAFYADYAHAFTSGITTPLEMATTFKEELTKCLTNNK